MATTRYTVSGLTCGHCVAAVSSELGALPGVTDVTIDLVPGADSTVAVTSDAPLSDDAVRDALEEAGDYRLVTAP